MSMLNATGNSPSHSDGDTSHNPSRFPSKRRTPAMQNRTVANWLIIAGRPFRVWPKTSLEFPVWVYSLMRQGNTDETNHSFAGLRSLFAERGSGAYSTRTDTHHVSRIRRA